MILVPELTLTRAKYWMNDYPIVLRDLQILDKQIYKKSKNDPNEFFTNNTTILSIWFETCLQKEEWFHKFVLLFFFPLRHQLKYSLVLIEIDSRSCYDEDGKTSNESINPLQAIPNFFPMRMICHKNRKYLQ